MDTIGALVIITRKAMTATGRLISVIVVCKNPGRRLSATLESLWAQQSVQPEIIVVDGCSTDGTRHWLETQRSRLSALLSEPDGGVYDAMNKGLVRAQGDWIFFLGADDRMASSTVCREMLNAVSNSTAEVAAGTAVFDDGRVYRLRARTKPIMRNFVHHQATFYRRELFSRHGHFDPSLAIMGDYDFNLRLWIKGVRFESIPVRVANCGSGGLSDAGTWLVYREEIAVRHQHLPFASCLIWDAASIARFVRKKAVRLLQRQHG